MKEFTQDQISALSGLIDSRQFSTGQSNRELHLHDISPHYGILPAGIIWPLTTEEVSAILSWCYDNDVPVTPWGAGTSTEGNPVPTDGPVPEKPVAAIITRAGGAPSRRMPR